MPAPDARPPGPRPSPAEIVFGVFPGARRPGLLAAALGSAALALALVLLVVVLRLSLEGKVLLGTAGLLAWGHGVGWLVTGSIQRLDSALADLTGPSWLVFLATWWAPLWLGWFAFGALFSAE